MDETNPTKLSRRWSNRAILDVVVSLVLVVAAGTVIAKNTALGSSRPSSEAPVPTQPLFLDNSARLGLGSAKVVVIEFSDFECPYCGKFGREVLPTLRERYVDKGLVELAFRHFPLSSHKHAQKAAEAAECAQRQGKFWTLHDGLFTHQQELDPEGLRSQVESLGLDNAAFERCFSGNEGADQVAKDAELARQLKIHGTPTFFLGVREPDGRIRVRTVLSGARPAEDFSRALDSMLRTVS